MVTKPRFTKRAIKEGLLYGTLLVVLLGGTGGVLYASYLWFGLLDTVIYVTVFGFSAAAIPSIIAIFGPSFPKVLRNTLGKLNFTLGQLSFGFGYLVQTKHGWKMCPGTEEKVYIGGEWRNIDGGQANLSVLGWKPFGVIRNKTPETWQEYRVDPAAQTGDTGAKVTDGGGTPESKRGGYTELAPDPKVSGLDGEWLIDLKRVYSGGLSRISDISILEKTEEVTSRNEARQKAIDNWGATVGGIVGLVLGVATGLVMLGGI